MTIDRCPLCGDAGGAPYLARHGRHFLRCGVCGLLWVREGLARDEAGVSIYEQDNPVFFDHGNDDYYVGRAALRNAEVKAKRVKDYLAPGVRAADIGAGFGHFVAACSALGTTVRGFEISPVAIEWAHRHLGLSLTRCGIESLSPENDGSLDLVTFWDVIEHVERPAAVLRRIRRLLRPGARLILSTPDAGSVAARLLGRHWYYLDPIQHITVFDRVTIRAALTRAGFRVEAIATMGHYYDPSYVLARLRFLYPRVFGILPPRSLDSPETRYLPLVYLNPGDVMVVDAVAEGSP